MTYLPTYKPAYLPTQLHTCLPTHLPTYVPTVRTYTPAHLPTDLPSYLPTCLHPELLKLGPRTCSARMLCSARFCFSSTHSRPDAQCPQLCTRPWPQASRLHTQAESPTLTRSTHAEQDTTTSRASTRSGILLRPHACKHTTTLARVSQGSKNPPQHGME